jgi:hypothetical protein
MFIRGRVAVTAEGVVEEAAITPETDVIFIYPKMPFGVRQQVIGASLKVNSAAKTSRGKKGKRSDNDVNVDLGAWNMALLEHNIIGWQGPSFNGIALTQANIRLLDDTQPLIQRVLQEINNRNTTADAESETEDEEDGPNVLIA